MPRHCKFWLLLALLTAVLSQGASAREKPLQPLPPGMTPNWVAVPGAPGVQYAPNVPSDIFGYRNQYYCYQGNAWYSGQTLTGPWMPLKAPPHVFYQIEAPYFKTPPGWAKGKKKGWGGAPMPPGQMKKMYGP